MDITTLVHSDKTASPGFTGTRTHILSDVDAPYNNFPLDLLYEDGKLVEAVLRKANGDVVCSLGGPVAEDDTRERHHIEWTNDALREMTDTLAEIMAVDKSVA